MSNPIRHSICMLLSLCISTASLEGSAALVETMSAQDSGPSDECKRRERFERFSPQQQAWLQLLINKQYEEAIATIDPQIHNPYSLSLYVLATKHLALVNAFVEKTCLHFEEDMWHLFFHYASAKGYLSVCKLLWELRYLAKDDPFHYLITALVEASIRGDTEFVTWSLAALKESNALGLINTMKAMLADETKSRKQGSGLITTEHHYWHPIGPAACNNHRDIVITLLQHGADPTIEAGDMSALRYSRTYRHNKKLCLE